MGNLSYRSSTYDKMYGFIEIHYRGDIRVLPLLPHADENLHMDIKFL